MWHDKEIKQLYINLLAKSILYWKLQKEVYNKGEKFSNYILKKILGPIANISK